MSDRVEAEVQAVTDHTVKMMAAYLNWGDKITVGDEPYWHYSELIEFVNFRMETAHTCLDLIQRDKIADALGLCRALMENYLLFMLMCRGHKYFQLVDKTSLTEGEFKKYITDRQAELADAQKDGTATVLAVEKYSRMKRHVMYVREGLTTDDDPEMMIPAHYFHFTEFRPEVMRLKQGDYFEYVTYDSETQKTLKGHQQEAANVYRHYLSYDALLTCLELNDLVDAAAITRIEAHYTFLGQFLHPTNDAARDLHENSNQHEGKPNIGMRFPYKSSARLLAALYVCYLVAGLLEEVALLYDNAPAKCIADPGTAELHSLINEVTKKFHYFWFLFNEPTLYDKFVYCNTHANDEQLKDWGGYANTPSELIAFNQHILGHLESALNGWNGGRVGHYEPPFI